MLAFLDKNNETLSIIYIIYGKFALNARGKKSMGHREIYLPHVHLLTMPWVIIF